LQLSSFTSSWRLPGSTQLTVTALARSAPERALCRSGFPLQIPAWYHDLLLNAGAGCPSIKDITIRIANHTYNTSLCQHVMGEAFACPAPASRLTAIHPPVPACCGKSAPADERCNTK
jgi:hypothetical protein